jgi:dTDP-4-dehydrorhamnose 3,5-epimerase
VFGDSRGWFVEQYNAGRYKAAGIDADFVQDNESFSSKGVVRGLHWQAAPHTQAKLVRVVRGAVWDVAVDIRKGSPTFGRHVSVTLSAENCRQFYIPRGFAHGFSVLSEKAVFAYKCDNLYHPECEGGVLLSDPTLNIDWQVPAEARILSEKDTKHPLFNNLVSPF